MAKEKDGNQTQQETPQAEEWLGQFLNSDVLKIYGKRVGIGVLIVAVALSVFLYQRNTRVKKSYDRHKQLGPAYVYFSRNQLDSAALFLTSFVNGPHKSSVLSKAYLLLGNAHYELKKYDEALEAYQKVSGSPGKLSLVTSGAQHGIAACYMQIREYQKAAEVLEAFVNTYMKQSRNPGNRKLGKKSPDLSPVVPNVLWKLALCYQQLKALDKVKETCETLISVYGTSEEAGKARRLLVTI